MQTFRSNSFDFTKSISVVVKKRGAQIGENVMNRVEWIECLVIDEESGAEGRGERFRNPSPPRWLFINQSGE